MTGELMAVLDTLGGIAQKFAKPYCFPSQKKILGCLERYHGIKVSLRTINRWLAALEDQGYFVRVRRHIRGENGGIIFRSTLYKLTGKYFNYLGRLAKRLKGFFGVFRVPKLAQHLPNYGQGSSDLLPGGVVEGPGGLKVVERSAQRSGNSGVPEALRDILRKIAG
jgi:hypothetical protein